jgi:hypothetical protein
MKRVGVWAIGIGLVITVGFLTVEQGYAKEADDEPTCTLNTLKGRYLFGGIATLAPPSLWDDGRAVATSRRRISYLSVEEMS